MLGLILSAAAVAAAAPILPPPAIPEGEARNVALSQLQSPPRTGPAAGLSAEEAEVVMERYLASIGKPLVRDDDSSASSTGSLPR